MIVRTGTDCRCLFLIIEGSLGVYSLSEAESEHATGDPIRIKNKRVREHGPGDFICGACGLHGARCSAFYAAMAPTRIIWVPSYAMQVAKPVLSPLMFMLSKMKIGFLNLIVAASAMQPVFSNQPQAVRGAAEWMSQGNDGEVMMGGSGLEDIDEKEANKSLSVAAYQKLITKYMMTGDSHLLLCS